jgi:transcriptional regulator with XRE-family HTH domain
LLPLPFRIGIPVTEESFGRRLRRERERRQIALSSISANTKISVTLLQALERDDVSRWPGGIFRRAFIRAYADGIGLDPDDLTREFLERFPDPSDPPPPAAVSGTGAMAAPRQRGALRLTLADAGGPFARGRTVLDLRQRLTAVVCDAAVVLAIAIVVFVASGDFWTPLAMATLIYYSAGILLLGNSPGVCLAVQTRQRSRADVGGDASASDALTSAIGFIRRLNRTDWTRAVWRTFRTHG